MNINDYTIFIMRQLPRSVSRDAILAGGALRALFDGTEAKDVDLFFRNLDDYEAAVAVMDVNSRFVKCPDAGGTKNYIDIYTQLHFNLVGFHFGTPQETIERFDFRCCRLAAWLDGGDVFMVADPHAVADCKAKRLVVMLSNGEDRTLRRIKHYEEDYGYTAVILEVGEEFATVGQEDPFPGFAPHVPKTPPPVPREEKVRRFIRSLPQGHGGY